MSRFRLSLITPLSLGLALSLTSLSSVAQPLGFSAYPPTPAKSGFGRAIAANERGGVSMSDAMTQVQRSYPGKILSAELDEKSGTYKMRVLGNDGRMRNIDVDRNTGNLTPRNRRQGMNDNPNRSKNRDIFDRKGRPDGKKRVFRKKRRNGGN